MANHPDWARFGISPPNKFSALGDPTRWGAAAVLNTPVIDGVIVTGSVEQSGQILTAQCRDGYSRAWTMAGTIAAPAGLALGFPDGAGLDQWALAAYVSMGVGQTAIAHSFNLRAINAADQPFYWNSDLSTPFFQGAVPVLTLPFIIPGAMVGSTMNVQIVQSFFASTPQPSYRVTVSLIVTPFDSGAIPNVGGPTGGGANP